MYKKEAVLIGAGKIGRGYMAYIFNNAGYKMTFLEYSHDLVEKLRDQKYYTVFMQHKDNGEWSKFRITNYEAYCTETERQKCVDVLAHANYATVHLFPGAIQSIGHMIGEAAKQRMHEGNTETLDIIFVINFLDADVLFRQAALEVLHTDEERAFLDKYIGFVYGLVRGRGPMPNAEMLAEDPLAISCADNDYLPVDVEQMKGPMPEGVNFVPAHHVGDLVKRKVWGGNVSHCANSFYGKQRGYTYGYESQLDKYIMKCASLAAKEANAALLHNLNVNREEVDRYFGEDKKEERFDPSKVNTEIKDTLDRIGSDPKRKLARNDRFIGPALLSIKSGRVPYFLARGAAMGFYFVNPEDSAAVEIQNFIKENGIEKAIEKYCELDLQDKDENFLYQLILANYYEIGDYDPFDIRY